MPNDAHQIAVLLRASRELDIIGDVTATVDSPGELVAWARLLPAASLIAWRAEDTGRRYLCLSAVYRRAPIRGQISITLDGDQHRVLWGRLLGGSELRPGTELELTLKDLFRIWSTPIVTN